MEITSSSLLFCQRARPHEVTLVWTTADLNHYQNKEGCLLPQKSSKINQLSHSCSIFCTLFVTPGSESDRRSCKEFPHKNEYVALLQVCYLLEQMPGI